MAALTPLAPAMAQTACVAPAAPPALDGANITKDQLLAGIKAAKSFMAQSDVYQDCVHQAGKDAKAQAAAEHKLFDTAADKKSVDAKLDANQKMKISVSDAINNAIRVYKENHPN